MKNCVPLGVFSEGTLRYEDIGSAIADLLDPLGLRREHRHLVRRWRAGSDTSDLRELVDELWSALDCYLPPYTYAGGSEGDGACFGVWPVLDASLPKVAEAPNNSGDCYVVSDHGNVSCGYRDRRGVWHEYWAVV